MASAHDHASAAARRLLSVCHQKMPTPSTASAGECSSGWGAATTATQNNEESALTHIPKTNGSARGKWYIITHLNSSFHMVV